MDQSCERPKVLTFSVITTGNLSKVSEVVSLHLQVEYLALWISCISY